MARVSLPHVEARSRGKEMDMQAQNDLNYSL